MIILFSPFHFEEEGGQVEGVSVVGIAQGKLKGVPPFCLLATQTTKAFSLFFCFSMPLSLSLSLLLNPSSPEAARECKNTQELTKPASLL